MTRQQQQFLELLRAGLWGIPADIRLFQDDVDWRTILRIAKEQTVQVIVADGIETLPQKIWPPKQAMLQLMMTRIKTQQLHQLLNATLNQITEALNAEGIPSFLLKGQGVAQNYRLPESRMCGDIDLYVGTGNYPRACEIVKGLNTEEQTDTPESEQHMHLELNGVTIEVHRIASTINQRSKAADFAEWTKAATSDAVTNGTGAGYDNLGTRINLPEETFNAFFILYHAVRHMFSEGVGFRQLCDWSMFLHRNHDKINAGELQKKLKEYRLTAIWKEFSILAHKVIGLPKEYIPFYPADDNSRKTGSLAKHIFISGNFGHYDSDRRDSREKNYLKRKWRSFRVQSSRLFKLSGLFPAFTLTYGWGWFTDSMKVFILNK